jgi:hypothetical protein
MLYKQIVVPGLIYGISEKRSWCFRLSSHQFLTWDQGPLYMSTTSWSLNNSIHETMDHYLSIQHHGLFSLIPYMRPGTTLSVYTTSWSLINHFIHETRDHSICHMESVRRDHGVVYTDRVIAGLVHDTDEKRPWWSHALNWWEETTPIPYMRPVTTLSVYTTSWSFLTNPIHENRDHSICLYNTVISSHSFHAWDQQPLYLSIQHHSLFSPIPYMRPVTPVLMYGINEKKPRCCIDR